MSTGISAPQWRQYPFFDKVTVRDVHDAASTPDVFKSAPEISTIASSSAGVIVADIHGSVHLLNRDFESISSWVAHVGGRVTHMVERKGILVTLGEEDTVRSPLLKIWDLNQKDKRTTAPLLLRSVKVQLSNRPHPVTTLALSATLSHLAIGLGDGTVLIYRHLDQALAASSTSLTAIPKPRVIHESPTEPVTGLGFREPTPAPAHDSKSKDKIENMADPNLYLFISTTNHVLVYQATGRGSGANASVVDEIGCGLGCATMDGGISALIHGESLTTIQAGHANIGKGMGGRDSGRVMFVAREEALYMVGIDGRGNCFAHEGLKASVQVHAAYLVIVSPPAVPSASAASATMRNIARAGDVEGEVTKVTVFDPANKLVVFTGTFIQGVRDVITAPWGNLYVLENNGELTHLSEKPTSAKLDMLYSRGFYSGALTLARTHGLDESSVADIHRQYGDYLYSRGEYDASMSQYVKTLGHVKASYVIRKFLDAQRIHNLVTYLQELHAQGLANSDHTTLLLNTYTKLKDVARLDSFIKTESKAKLRQQDKSDREEHDPEELPFDLDTAIRVCRQAGYFDHAGYLAKKYERHEEYLRIQIEDAERYADALAYFRKLGVDAAESNLARYGRALLANLPEETTQLLIDLCTSTGTNLEFIDTSAEDTPVSNVSAAGKIGAAAAGGASYLSYLSLNKGSTTGQVSDTATIPAPSIKTVKAGDSSSIRDETATVKNGEGTINAGSVSGTPRTSSPPPTIAAAPAPAVLAASGLTATTIGTARPPRVQPVKRLSPRLYFAHFVDHMEQFVVFLETVAKRRWDQSLDADTDSKVKSNGAANNGVVDSPVDEEDTESEKKDQVAVWNTLLELYLTLPGVSATATSPAQSEETLRDKAIRILQSKDIPYDPTHALILCSSHGCTKGLVLLWEKMGMYEDVLRFWMDRDKEGVSEASAEVVRHLRIYGPQHPHLYPLVLRFLTSSSELLSRHKVDVKEVIEHIDKEGILPPLGVVQILSRNNVASVGLVKEWLIQRIKQEREEIQTDQEWMNSYRMETAEKRKQVEELSNPEHPKSFTVTRCSQCKGQLDLPSIHFMCNHSYHQRCLPDNDTECPNCAREHGVIREIRRNNEQLASQHDVFLSEVKEGGFKAVADAFSRGIFNVSRVEEAAV
ncbi:vacuolar membrane protein [Moniliophthora roreri]|uniref:RING-type domain-containing protein n=1 Tax=Moniliophthora roreri TaxID=221103 RepID=A0A0W0FJ87_MONRR|nr:vacuolar membrane protein [Moniliophthora roreri]